MSVTPMLALWLIIRIYRTYSSVLADDTVQQGEHYWIADIKAAV